MTVHTKNAQMLRRILWDLIKLSLIYLYHPPNAVELSYNPLIRKSILVLQTKNLDKDQEMANSTLI